MASSYSTDLKLELMVTGENAGTWGDNTNNNLNLIQQAIAGYEAVALSDGGTVALAMTDKTISNARNMVIKFTGTLTTASTVTIPDGIEKFYIFDCSAVVGPTNLTIKTASGTGFTLDRAAIFAAYSDATNLNEISLGSLGGTVAAAQITPAGSDKQIQFNNNGSLGAIAIGTCGQVLTSDGTSASFQDPAGGGAVSWQTGSIKTANFTAVAGEGYFANTSGGAFTMTLPASPSAGDIVAVKDYSQNFNSNNLTVARNSSNIDGNANDVTLDNTAESITFIYVDGTQGWKVINNSTKDFAPAYVTATGGTITCCGDYKIHTFTGPGAFCVTNVGNSLGNDKISYMIVAGGGGGGSTNSTDDGAGGGAGGYREGKDACDPYSTDGCTATHMTLGTTGSYPVVVGSGGAGGPGTPSVPGTTGSDSSFNSIISAGGGAARGSGSGEPPSIANGGSGGGSGGGGGVPGNPGGAGNTPFQTPPQGNPGGAAAQSVPDGSAGGGGGALVAGGTAGGSSAPGGGGATSSITGTPTARAGGGGGATASGVDGGGPGNGTPGTTNTGGGGGGNQNGSTAGTGGSGIVVIRYKFQN
jgi:hypothetical protein